MSPGIDPQSLIRQAETHYGAGRPAAAKPLLEQLLRMIPGHPAILHLYGLVLSDLGDMEQARTALLGARKGAPRDPHIACNLGNLLGRCGNHQDALAAYDAAIAIDPWFGDARLHRAMILEDIRRFDDARAEFAMLAKIGPLTPAMAMAMASMERAAGHPGVAADYLDAVIAADPTHRIARIGRARLALDLGEPVAAQRYRQELSIDPHDRDLIIGYVDAADSPSARQDAINRLVDTVTTDPGWREGQRKLAELHWQQGDVAGLRASYEQALAGRPRDTGLWQDYIDVVARTDAHLDAAMLCDRACAATGLEEFRVAMFGFLSGGGATKAADELLAALPAGAIAPLALGKHRLRQRDAVAAEALLGGHVATAPDDIEAWALRSIAWQVLGDDRFHWLNDQPGMIGAIDLPIDSTDLGAIADYLRRLHADSALRLGQSVRGGAQTLGNLFDRRDSESRRLRDLMQAAIAGHRAALPPADPAHPVLQHRDQPQGFAGAWSIRLTGAGFHVQHIHPKGIWSAASYWALPAPAAEDPHAGWLEIGGAPEYLGLDLPPFRAIEPKLGRLILFPSTLHHGTRPFASGERITVAFDVIPTIS